MSSEQKREQIINLFRKSMSIKKKLVYEIKKNLKMSIKYVDIVYYYACLYNFYLYVRELF